MKLLTITTTKMPSKDYVIKVGSIITGKQTSFDESTSSIEQAIGMNDEEVLKSFKFEFCVDLGKEISQSLMIRAIMPFVIDISVKEEEIEFAANGRQLRGLLKRWLVMDNIYLQKMGASVVLDLIANDLVFLIRDILDGINKGEINET